jgi:hypothetical protein
LEYVRKITSHLGITSRGRNKIDCLKTLAELATGNYEVSKVVTIQYSRPLNGKFRLINCIFSDLHFNNFLELSQQISKDNLTDGKNISGMKKEFFKQVLQTYNTDTSKYIDYLQYKKSRFDKVDPKDVEFLSGVDEEKEAAKLQNLWVQIEKKFREIYDRVQVSGNHNPSDGIGDFGPFCQAKDLEIYYLSLFVADNKEFLNIFTRGINFQASFDSGDKMDRYATARKVKGPYKKKKIVFMLIFQTKRIIFKKGISKWMKQQ